MTLLELFRFLVPYFAALSDSVVQQALDLAAPYRPACLTPTQQDEAQIFYAAWLLYQRQMQTDALAGGGTMPMPGVKMEKEGDLQRQYGADFDGSDPFGWWAKYSDLNAACTGGAITVGRRHGSPCCGIH